MSAPLLLDTGGWLKALGGFEPWLSCLSSGAELIVPGLVLCELDYHLRRRRPAMHRVLADVANGAYRHEPPTEADLRRAVEIDQRFKGLELGLVDASVAALAERLGVYRVLTIDSDFAALRVGPRYQRSIELACPLPPLKRAMQRNKKGLKEQINEALRVGLLTEPPKRRRHRTRSFDGGACLMGTITSVSEALAIAEGEDFR